MIDIKFIMSILNHFGKVNTTFDPYTSKHSYGVNTLQSEFIHSYVADGTSIRKNFKIFTKGSCKLNWSLGHGMGIHDALGPGTQSAITYIENFIDDQHRRCHNAIYTDIQDFAKVIEHLVVGITSSIWKTVNINPVLTLTQLLCLKVDDVDSRVDHLEKMLKQVIDDNKLLQRKVAALEQQKRLKEMRVARTIGVLIQELD